MKSKELVARSEIESGSTALRDRMVLDPQPGPGFVPASQDDPPPRDPPLEEVLAADPESVSFNCDFTNDT